MKIIKEITATKHNTKSFNVTAPYISSASQAQVKWRSAMRLDKKMLYFMSSS
jgi:hypothetical protein